MKILLTNVKRGVGDSHLYFPLGLGYIAAALLNSGHDVEVFDVQNLTDEIIRKRVLAYDFDVIGISALITDIKYVQWVSRVIKERRPSVPIILGGGLSTVPELVLEKCDVDIVVCNEGDETIKDVVKALEHKTGLEEIRGIYYRGPGKTLFNGPAKPIEDLDALPFPAYDLFEVSRYLQTDKLGFSYPVKSLSIITTRGCPYHCVFCDKGVWGKKFRYRSAKSIVAEIKYLKGRFGINAVVFSDDLFVLNKARVHEFCDLLTSEKIHIAWSCNGRVNLMDEPLLRKMKRAGCMTVGYGIESGSQRMLDAMAKQTTVTQARNVIQLTRKAGMDIQPYLVFGMVGEDRESIRETVDFCMELGLSVGKFGIFTPLPNTRLYEIAQEMGRLPSIDEQIESWEDWTDRITVNLSNLSDSELLELKHQAEADIRRYYVLHHKMVIIKRILLRFRNLGPSAAALIFLNWLTKFIKYQQRAN